MAEIFKSKWADSYLALVYKQLGLKILVDIDIDIILSISHTGILNQCQCLEERNIATYFTLLPVFITLSS